VKAVILLGLFALKDEGIMII